MLLTQHTPQNKPFFKTQWIVNNHTLKIKPSLGTQENCIATVDKASRAQRTEHVPPKSCCP